MADSIINIDYFNGDLNIPNTDHEEVKADLELFINQYESKFLSELLGFETYKLFHDDIDYSVPEASISPWEELLSGAEFVDSHKRKNKWPGFIGDQFGIDHKESPIANFVYWHWMRRSVSQTVGVGVVKAKVENSTIADPNPKMVKAWNDMVEMLWIFHDFVTNDSDIRALLPDYVGYQFAPYRHPRHTDMLLGNQKLFVRKNLFGI